MIEQRCNHGYMRSCVPCPECDPSRYLFEAGDAVGAKPKLSRTRLGAEIAGVTITKEYDARWVQAECSCQRLWRVTRGTLVDCAARGASARCPKCIAKIRGDAQRRCARSRDLERQERQQRERQGAAA